MEQFSHKAYMKNMIQIWKYVNRGNIILAH